MAESNGPEQRPPLRWPKFVLGAVILWIVLIILWMSVLIHRTQQQRDFTPWPKPAAPTNSA